ncbi:MAG: hypothetical protein PWQ67_381 [Clostridia bacterium]|jgi:flagellar biosynthesis/type III secretory pathway M-ring protein FliF/YscJ|nr:hypothetical protein [Clostridia bacterium]MDN5321927.1 hypothetical protein [Clostridia bacterium]
MKFLVIFILLLIVGYYFWSFSKNRWEEVLTTQDVEKYMAIVGKLQAARIKYKTTTGGEEFNFRNSTLLSRTPPISYTIWIPKDQIYKAYKIINNN